MAKFGRAAITWTSTEDENTQRVLLLDAPLTDVMPGHTATAYTRESLDKTTLETFAVGTGAYELEGRIRYATNPQGVLDMVRAGSQGKTLTYYPDLADPGVSDSVLLVAPRSPAQLTLDGQRGMFGETEVVLRFRKGDETPFTPRTRGTEVLFSYRAGDSLGEITFTRSSVARYPSNAGGNGYGTLTSVAADKARIGWFASPTSVGPRSVPALMLEPQRTNVIPQSQNFSTSATAPWTRSNAVGTSAQADPAGGTAAWLLADNSTSQYGYYQRTPSLPGSAITTISAFLRQGTTQAPNGVSILFTATGQTNYVVSNLKWSSGVPTQTTAGGGVRARSERWGNGWWRFQMRTTAVTSTGYLRIYPAGLSSGQKGNVYVYGVQVEQ